MTKWHTKWFIHDTKLKNYCRWHLLWCEAIWLKVTMPMFQVQAEDARGEGGGPVHSWWRGREQRHCQWKFGGGLLRQCQEATCHVPQGVQLQISTFNITIHRIIKLYILNTLYGNGFISFLFFCVLFTTCLMNCRRGVLCVDVTFYLLRSNHSENAQGFCAKIYFGRTEWFD